MPFCAFEHCLRAGVPVFFEQRLFEASCVYADADGYAPLSARGRYLADILLAADVARIYADLIYSTLCNGKRQTIVKVDIRNKRHVSLLFNFRYGLGRCHIWYGKAHDLASGSSQTFYLPDRRRYIVRLCIAHRLNGDGRESAYLHSADGNLLGFLSFEHYAHPVMSLAMSLYIINPISSRSSTMPPAWI